MANSSSSWIIFWEKKNDIFIFIFIDFSTS